ncbi:MAG: UvrD-helicase domain-containing protein, partial [Ignavibacteriales bacterium]|nr:UvrD-helicase domain-containing protein [Ignavibacteriales bacterium]
MLTKNQLRALDFKHHLSVTANAGAGKTTVLVKRFINILLNTDAKVNELVAITFTEKAASELRKKIADSIDERVLHAADTVERERCENIRGKLITANIGTIHSFCAQLLRGYPVEADIDASFKV